MDLDRIQKRLASASDNDRKYERPMSWDEAAELVAALQSSLDLGRRDMLNALLSPNPTVAATVAELMGDPTLVPNPDGKLPFIVVLWVTCVAEQLGIEPKEEAAR